MYVKNGGKEDYPKVFAQLTRKDGSFIVGRENVENFTMADMKGKEILGGRRGGVPAMALEYALKENGLINGDGITINYDVQFDMIIPAFESGSGDYCTMFEPAASNFVASGKGYILGSVGEFAGNMPFTAFMAMQDYMRENPDKIEKFLRAIVKGMKFLEENTAEESAKVLEPSFNGTSVELLAKAIDAYKKIGAYSTSPIMNVDEFNHLQDVIIYAGVINSAVPYGDMVDNSYAERVLAELATKQ